MESTVKKYARRIASKKVSAHIPYDGRKNGMIVDPSDKAVPVDFVGFGAYQLSDGPFELESGNREMVFLPMEGSERSWTPAAPPRSPSKSPRRRDAARARPFHPEHRRVHEKRSNFATAIRSDFAVRAC